MSAQVHNFSYGQFNWWVGQVENRTDDPMKLGRVRVRIFGYHPESKSEVPEEDLPWATVMQPTNSAASTGVGSAPVGMLEGTHVIGFFADGANAQMPIVMGTLLGMPGGKPDTNELTRGEDLQNTVVKEKLDGVLTSSPFETSRNVTSLGNTVRNLSNQITNTGINLRSLTSNLSFPNLTGMLPSMSSIQLPTSIGMPTTSVDAITDAVNISEGLRDQVFRIEGLISQVRGLQASAENFDPKKMLQQEIDNYKLTVGALIDISGPAQVRNLRAAIDGISSIENAVGAIQKADSALRSISQIGSAIGNLKNLASSIVGGGAVMQAINQLKSGVLSNIWNEIPTPAAPEYPLNDVYVSEGGHIEEYDNTPGAERYHRYHPAGTFTEVHPDGSHVQKVVKDNYSIVMGDDRVHIEGNVQVNIVGTSSVAVNGDCVLQVSGDLSHLVDGDYTLAVGGEMNVVVAGAHRQSAGSQFLAQAPRIDLNR